MTKSLQTLPWLTKINIPAEIQDFWIRGGKKVAGILGNTYFVYDCSDETYYAQGGPPPPLRKDILAYGTAENMKYQFDNKWYDQEGILRVIKLAIFL